MKGVGETGTTKNSIFRNCILYLIEIFLLTPKPEDYFYETQENISGIFLFHSIQIH